MIACYVWTDLQLINMIHLYTNEFLEQPADLFVCVLDRMNEELLQKVEEEKIFRNIYRIPLVDLDDVQTVLWKIPLLKKAVVSIYRKKFYQTFYKKNIGSQQYDLLMVPGYWGEVLHLLSYLLKRNPKQNVILVEEGAAHYSASKKVLCQNHLNGGILHMLLKLLIMGRYYRKADTLPQKMYLYQPEARQTEAGIPLVKLPSLSQAAEVVHRCIHTLGREVDLQLYETNQIFFFQPADIPIYDGGDETTAAILKTIQSAVPEKGLMIKMHPVNTLSEEECRKRFATDAEVDCRILPFEVVADAMPMHEKIFVSRNSSCFLTVKYMFDMEPILIFTYRIYSGRSLEEDRDMPMYIEGLRQMYREKWKVMDISSLAELEQALKWLNDRMASDKET